jgi:hypothetical protein
VRTRILIAELRVNSKTDIQPTYSIVTPGVCATSEKVGKTLQSRGHFVQSRPPMLKVSGRKPM